MSDMVFVLAAILFFAMTWGLLDSIQSLKKEIW
jgi:hypothetical protein